MHWERNMESTLACNAQFMIWQDHSHFFSQKILTPPRQVPIGYYSYMSILFVLLAFVRVLVYCSLYCYHTVEPSHQTNTSSQDVVLYNWVASQFLTTINAANFGTARALYNSIKSLAISIPASKISNRNLYI